MDGWLDDNVTQETGYVLDSSLTMSNAAAPANKVGEVIDDLEINLYGGKRYIEGYKINASRVIVILKLLVEHQFLFHAMPQLL